LDFNIFDRRFKIVKHQISFKKIVQWGPTCSVRTDGQTGGRKLTVALATLRTDGQTGGRKLTVALATLRTDGRTDRQAEGS